MAVQTPVLATVKNNLELNLEKKPMLLMVSMKWLGYHKNSYWFVREKPVGLFKDDNSCIEVEKPEKWINTKYPPLLFSELMHLILETNTALFQEMSMREMVQWLNCLVSPCLRADSRNHSCLTQGQCNHPSYWYVHFRRCDPICLHWLLPFLPSSYSWKVSRKCQAAL